MLTKVLASKELLILIKSVPKVAQKIEHHHFLNTLSNLAWKFI